MKQVFLSAACCALLSGCATAPIFFSPVTKFSGTNCAAQPDISTAVSLDPKKKKKFHETYVPVDGSAQCLAGTKGNVPYKLLALPAVTENKVFEVGGAVEPLRVFSAEVSTLDANGATVRRFAKDQLTFRGGVYSVMMRALENEKYVMVSVDPEPVGKFFDSIQTSTSTTSVYTGFGSSSWTSGVDQNHTRAFSYEGTIVARVFDNSTSK
jgi:hypothetical protein